MKKYKLVVTEEPWGVKYSTGNGAAKEVICMKQGHEQRGGDCLREWEVLGNGGKGEKLGQL